MAGEGLQGRNGRSNAELVAAWPVTPDTSCALCWPPKRGEATWTLTRGALCADCLEFELWRLAQ